MDYIIKTNNISFSNGYSLNFEYPIKEVLKINSVIIVVVDPPFDSIYNNNAFAFGVTGDFLWRVGDVKLYDSASANCPYVGLVINADGELVLFNWCDTAVILNPLTGEVIRTYQTK